MADDTIRPSAKAAEANTKTELRRRNAEGAGSQDRFVIAKMAADWTPRNRETTEKADNAEKIDGGDYDTDRERGAGV